MKLIVRVKNPETRRYRQEQIIENVIFADSQHFVDSLHGVPFTLDSVVFGNEGISRDLRCWVNLSPAWNKKNWRVKA